MLDDLVGNHLHQHGQLGNVLTASHQRASVLPFEQFPGQVTIDCTLHVDLWVYSRKQHARVWYVDLIDCVPHNSNNGSTGASASLKKPPGAVHCIDCTG